MGKFPLDTKLHTKLYSDSQIENCICMELQYSTFWGGSIVLALKSVSKAIEIIKMHIAMKTLKFLTENVENKTKHP